MADATATPTAAPVPPVAAPAPVIRAATIETNPAKRRPISTRAIGIAILVVAIIYSLGPKLPTLRNNLMQRAVDVTDPSKPWSLPEMNPEISYPIILILAIFALAWILHIVGRKL
jgi:hypothetical protein